MNLSRKWLSEFVDLDVSNKEFEDAMTMSGSKVELTTYLGENVVNVVVGKLLSVDKHPNADKLSVCSVEIGESEPITIVTGATNIKAGDIVPVAKDNSLLPCGKEIHAGELRGILSNGMLCSMGELGLTQGDIPYGDPDGILILQEDCTIGQDIREVLGFDDYVVEFEITPNRPDCLSVIGLAREASVTFNVPLNLHDPVVKSTEGDITELLDIEIAAPDLCSRYTARMIKNVKIEPSPKWMRERLRASGVRPVNNIVDITNYVMLEYGQPMHAFDFSCVTGNKIIVRRAGDDTEFATLDDTKRTLTPDMLVIADTTRPVGIAGVMGGANSEIKDSTEMVVFESANFNGTSIRHTATALGMRTDASGRFEKGLDPMLTYPAVQRACELVELLGAGEVIDGIIDVVGITPEPAVLPLESEKINRLLGTDFSSEYMENILIALGFTIENGIVTAPTWRSDIEHYSDLAEEVARFYGYDNLPATIMGGVTLQGGYTFEQKQERLLGSLCRSLGYYEIMTYSFVSPSDFDKILIHKGSELRNTLTILNPLGEERSIMRTTSLPSMLDTVARNISYRNKSAKLYELAKIYPPIGSTYLADEHKILTLGAYGSDMDFFALKGAVEAILEGVNAKPARFEAVKDNPSYHPGRCASVTCDGMLLGYIGQIHPLVAEKYDISAEVYAAELDIRKLLTCLAPESSYVPLPRFPATTRDLAVVCDASVTVAQLSDCIRAAGNEYLRDVMLFDIYSGAPIPEGSKSVAFNLVFRADDRTLTDTGADLTGILEALEAQLGAKLR